MGFWCVQFMLFLTLVERIWSLPLACPYNGTSYKEGENVKTEEPCLSCVCQKGALECSLRVCAEYPSVLPPDCFLVHKPNDCCPQLLCEEGFRHTGIELRTGFKMKTKLNGNDCVINGSVYAEGSAVASSRVCEYCYCVEGEMKCIKPRCLQSFEGCKPIYEKSSCCPTHYDCRDADVDHLTFQIKNFAKVRSTVSTDSQKSLSSIDTTTSEEYLYDNESITTGYEETETMDDEFVKTTTEEINTQVTTTEPEESTTSLSGDETTTFGLQKADNESTTVAFTEPTTFEPETMNVSSYTVLENQKETSSVQTRSKMDFPEENSAKISENSPDNDDYDSYDYSEPQLPPSLPNVVIFPFVAADAVVKDDNADPPGGNEDPVIERIDAHPVFYKDYFSPPLKTEGGFMPKEPTILDESMYKKVYFKEQITPPSAASKDNSGIRSETNASPLTLSGNCISDGQEILPRSGTCVTCTCQRGEVVCQDDNCPEQKPENIILENQKGTESVALDGFGETLQLATETPSDFSLKPTEFHKSYQTKKPVTVTYKNFVIDFYPNYLVTTTRGHLNLQTQNTIVSLTTTTTTPPPFNFYNEADTSAPTETQTNVSTITTTETSFFEEFVKSFLTKDETTEPATSTTKFKYSSKIKVSTVKPKQEETSKVNSTNYLYSWLNAIMKPETATEKSNGVTQTQELKQIDEPSTSDTPVETISPKTDLSETPEEVNLLSEKSDSITTKPNVENLLKLAGCNIYGMMYRVGKIITELSGPCLECLCTELGVQCKPLKC